MKSATTPVIRIPRQGRPPRRNFGDPGSRKRTESNFLRAFERAYLAGLHSSGVAAEEFALSGHGIADLVWIGWSDLGETGGFSALSFEKRLARRHLFAFEGKIKDWRRALQQAFRYRYFADKAIVVMPHSGSGPALENLDTFRHAQVGFWTFDKNTKVISEHFTPTRIRAFNSEARWKAIRMLTSKINFGQLSKQTQAVAD